MSFSSSAVTKPTSGQEVSNIYETASKKILLEAQEKISKLFSEMQQQYSDTSATKKMDAVFSETPKLENDSFKIKALEEQIELLKKEKMEVLTGTSQHFLKLQTRIIHQNETIARLEALKTENDPSEIEKLETIEKLKTQILHVKNAHNNLADQLKLKNSELKDTANELRKEKIALSSRNEQFEALNTEMHQKITAYEESIKQATTSMSDWEKEKTALSSRNKEVEALNTEMHQKITTYEESIKQATTNRSDWEKEKSTLSSKNKELEALNTEMHQKITTTASDWEKEKSTLSSKNKELEALNIEMHQKITRYKEIAERTESEKTWLKAVVKEMEDYRDIICIGAQKLQNKVHDLEIELKNTKKTNS
jgi:chromosome segregation ATPase